MVVCATGKEKRGSNQTIIPKILTFRIERALFANNYQAGTAADYITSWNCNGTGHTMDINSGTYFRAKIVM